MTAFGPGTVEAAIARLEALPDESARAAAREAVAAVLAFHREGLTALCSRLDAGPEGEKILLAAAEDPAAANMLLLHGLHPLSLGARVHRALDEVRASASSRGADIEVLSLNEHAVRLRAGGGKSLRAAVERAVAEAAPEVDEVEVVEFDPDLIPPERLLGARQQRHAPGDRCEICSEPLGDGHSHLFEVKSRELACACRACSALFDSRENRYRRVRRKVVPLDDFRITDAQWEALQVPVGLAFFSRSSTLGSVVAAYPGPAGAIEATVSPGAWEALVRDNPALADLEPDVMALFVDRLTARPRYLALSIDECYRLTGLVRSRWQGLTGGKGVVGAVEEFFGSLAITHPPEARP